MSFLEIGPSSDCIPFPVSSSDDPAKCSISLRHANRTKESVAYKVKTTQPRSFLVKPSQGCLAPGESTQIWIVLMDRKKQQVLRSSNGNTSSKKDQFLIQACPITSPSSPSFSPWSRSRAPPSTEQEWAVFWKQHIQTSPRNDRQSSLLQRNVLAVQYRNLDDVQASSTQPPPPPGNMDETPRIGTTTNKQRKRTNSANNIPNNSETKNQPQTPMSTTSTTPCTNKADGRTPRNNSSKNGSGSEHGGHSESGNVAGATSISGSKPEDTFVSLEPVSSFGRKYDDLVRYAVTLSQERDSIELELLQARQELEQRGSSPPKRDQEEEIVSRSQVYGYSLACFGLGSIFGFWAGTNPTSQAVWGYLLSWIGIRGDETDWIWNAMGVWEVQVAVGFLCTFLVGMHLGSFRSS